MYARWTRWRQIAALGSAFIAVWATPPLADAWASPNANLCLSPVGDVNQDSITDVLDLQCVILGVLEVLAGATSDSPLPACLEAGWGALDVNCDSDKDVVDALLTVLLALDIPVESTLDTNGDNCPDACQPVCEFSPFGSACDDQNPCTMDDTCQDSGCAGTPQNCDDQNPCTQDACVGGECQNTPIECEDGDLCTTDSCSPDMGGCWAMATDCDDGNACTEDSCAPDQGCVQEEVECDDGQPCTDNLCDSGGGCFFPFNNAPCDDGNACTTFEVCMQGWCAGMMWINCDDGSECTDDWCDWSSGCQHVPIGGGLSCDDGNECTAWDECTDAGVCQGTFPDCEGMVNILCIVAQINLPAWCADGTLCDDNDVCTVGDAMWKGYCEGAPLFCFDGNDCTLDECSSDLGCQFPPSDDPCDDWDQCTVDDMCMDGWCQGQPIDCGDGDPCTDDGCWGDMGCYHSPNYGPCDDGNACTTPDQCGDGGCMGMGALDCDDGNPCTPDYCDPASGCVTAGGNPCDDGNQCTVDACGDDGGCMNTDISDNCDDQNECTADSCDPASGCVYTPIPCYPAPDLPLVQHCEDTSAGGTGCYFLSWRPSEDGDNTPIGYLVLACAQSETECIQVNEGMIPAKLPVTHFTHQVGLPGVDPNAEITPGNTTRYQLKALY